MTTLHTTCPNCGHDVPIRTATDIVREAARAELSAYEVAGLTGLKLPTVVAIYERNPDLPRRRGTAHGSVVKRILEHASPDRTVQEIADLSGTNYNYAYTALRARGLPYKMVKPREARSV